MLQYLPSVQQARQLNLEMHAALVSSLRNVAGQAADVLSESTINAFGLWAGSRGTAETLPPSAFGAYYELVNALQCDEFDRADTLFHEIMNAPERPKAVQVRRLGHDYDADTTRRFQAYMGNGKTDASGIAPPALKDAHAFTENLNAALAILSEHCPELAQEFHELIREIILVAPDGSSDSEFEGGTSFKLWGALFLNAECTPTPAQLAVTLAHEQGHAVLFGMCREEMLVHNLDDERFWSPIRQAKRPMEGIFHATFVSARMIDVLITLRRNMSLGRRDRTKLDLDLETSANVYEEGVEIISRHARMTETGQAIFEDMTRTMDDRFAKV